MLQSLEILILQAILWVYSHGPLMGLLIFGVPAVWLMVVQFFKQGRNIIPGLIAIPFIGALFYHLIPKLKVNAITYFNSLLTEMTTPAPERTPIPLLEFFYDYFIAPYQYRSMLEEVVGTFFLVYIGSIIFHSYQGYKKTGIIIGELNLGGFFKKVQPRPKRSETNELGSSDLATTEMIASWTKPSSDPDTDTVLYVSDLRGSEGLAYRQAKLIFPREARNRHVLIVAKTGGGKTTKLILPLLYNDCLSKERTTIVIDSKPEMWQKLASMTRKYNPEKNIVLFNPLDIYRSLSWNILAKVEDDTDCKLIADTIIKATDVPGARNDSPFFRNNALSILNAIMVGLLEDRRDGKDELSMPRVHQIVHSGNKGLADWLESHPSALRFTKAFVELVRSGSQNADTIVSELAMRVNAWDIKTVQSTTWQNEIDLEDLVKKPSLFIVEFRESELEMLRPLANVIVVELLRFLTKYAEKQPGTKLPRPVSLVIDEFASAIGRLPEIHVKLNTLRSRNISIIAAIQSTAQIKANYETHAESVIAGFSTRIFMPPLDMPDAELASKDTGQMTIRFKTESSGTNRKIIEWFASRNINSQEQVQQRAVLTPDEIGRPADDICTFFMPNTRAFQGHLIPYYKIPELLKRITDSEKSPELKLRDEPIKLDAKLLEVTAAGSGGSSVGSGGLPPGITNTRGWSEEKIVNLLNETKKKLDWDNTTGSARKWWEAFENENKHRMGLVLRLAEELSVRKATVTEFFLAYVYSNTDNIQANLHYLDYTRLKKEEEKKRREAAQKAKAA